MLYMLLPVVADVNRIVASFARVVTSYVIDYDGTILIPSAVRPAVLFRRLLSKVHVDIDIDIDIDKPSKPVLIIFISN
jgi:hypothetical protein